MVTESARNNASMSQRSTYDERYSVGLCDIRSAVPVLTAERAALSNAIGHALTSHPHVRRINVFDFVYGTGRVINDWIERHARRQLPSHDLRVVAYDVSSVGLRRAQGKLRSAGCEPAGSLTWEPGAHLAVWGDNSVPVFDRGPGRNTT